MYSLLRNTSLALICLSGITPAAAENEKVVASYLPIMQTTAFYVALEEGMFKEAGIDIEPRRFENPNQIVDSLVGGQADFGPPGTAAGIAVLAEARFPGTFKVFGLQGGSIELGLDNDALIVAADSEIESFSDLQGQSVGTVPGIQWRTILTHILRANDLEPGENVELRELSVGQQITSVASGAVDATLSLEPIGSIADNIEDVRKAENMPVAQHIADPFYSGAAVLTNTFIEERPEVAKKVVQVIDEATQLANENFDEYRPIIAEYTAVSEAQSEFVAQPYLRAWNDLNETDVASYQAFVDVFYQNDVLEEPMNIDELILTDKDFD